MIHNEAFTIDLKIELDVLYEINENTLGGLDSDDYSSCDVVDIKCMCTYIRSCMCRYMYIIYTIAGGL